MPREVRVRAHYAVRLVTVAVAYKEYFHSKITLIFEYFFQHNFRLLYILQQFCRFPKKSSS